MVVQWERERDLFARERGVICIWSSGIIVNQAELSKRCELPLDSSHTQLITALYQQEGIAVANLIFGSCAWVVWDGRCQQLIATRDRVGLQPLYYVQYGSVVAISERVEALLPLLPSAEINLDAV